MPTKADMIRVELIEHAQVATERDDATPGIYRWQHQEDDYRVSERSLRDDLKTILPDAVDAILARLYNFRVVYINKRTGEVFT